MNFRTLAKALRRRQLRLKLVEKSAINLCTDADMVDCYVKCKTCHMDIFADSAAAVRNSKNVDEFLTLVNMALAAHRCPAQN